MKSGITEEKVIVKRLEEAGIAIEEVRGKK